ncbi:MAG: Arc family DNA binding domain-containing protein [Verrucomicrobia bacterium]|nr:Arc family DNA binding domain-containing protein [Verrucomicrobiota bacterium]
MAERKSFLIRIDPALWAELEAWAQQELRSVNGQIEYLLRDAVLRRKRSSSVQTEPQNASLESTKPIIQ